MSSANTSPVAGLGRARVSCLCFWYLVASCCSSAMTPKMLVDICCKKKKNLLFQQVQVSNVCWESIGAEIILPILAATECYVAICKTLYCKTTISDRDEASPFKWHELEACTCCHPDSLHSVGAYPWLQCRRPFTCDINPLWKLVCLQSHSLDLCCDQQWVLLSVKYFPLMVSYVVILCSPKTYRLEERWHFLSIHVSRITVVLSVFVPCLFAASRSWLHFILQKPLC